MPVSREDTDSQAWSFDEFLSGFRPREKRVPITMRGDLLSRLDVLERELEDVERTTEANDSLDGPTGLRSAVEIAQEIIEVRDEVKASSRDFVVVAIGDRRWSDLIIAHKPTGEDKKVGMPWDPQSFYPAALAQCITQPAMSADQCDKLLDMLAAGQVLELVNAMLDVNGGGDDLPKSAALSVLRRFSEQKPTTSSLGASRAASSSDG